MAITVKHKFVSAKPDGKDSSLVQPSKWNEDHDIVMGSGNLLGRKTDGDGAVEEIAVSGGLTLDENGLSASGLQDGIAAKSDIGHGHAIADVAGLQAALDANTAEISDETTRATAAEGSNATAISTHSARTDNPHAVTKSQVGLGNVDNTADASKPISTAMQTALDGKQPASANLTAWSALATSTKQDALGFTAENAANKGAAGGYASLDGSGKVPSEQLPSFVDDVIEATDFASLPGTGETGKIYVTLDNGKVYRWSGTAYVEISASPGSTDAVPEGSSNLYHTAARVNALISAAVGSVTQAYSAVLSGLAALSPTAFGKSLLELASAAALRTAIALPTATTVGRLARYTDTAGAIGSTAGLYEDNAGNVGMGTASPEAALHVANGGKIVLDGGLGGTMRGIIKHAADIYNPSSDAIYITPGDGAGRRIFLGESGKPFYALNLGYVSNIEQMPAFATGQHPLQVGSAGSTAVFRNDAYPFLGFNGLVCMSGRPTTGSDVGDFAWYSADQWYPGNVSGYTQRMVLTRAGNLGLGVSAPAVKLDVDGAIKVKTYTVATAPSAAVAAGQIIYVSDESSGATLAFSDGTDWRRASDRAVIS